MPWYHIMGMDRETGEYRERVLEASSEDAAVRQAGFVVEMVRSGREPEPEPEPEPRPAPWPPTPAKPAADEKLERNFYALTTAAYLLRIAGGVLVVLSLFGTLGNLAGVLEAIAAPRSEGAAVLGEMMAFGASITVMVFGILVYAAGEALVALRVIAINSFRD